MERLMREAALVGRAATLYRRIPGIEKFYARHRNLRLAADAPTAPDQQWVADLTYIRVAREWCYLATVMDRYSRRVIGWSLGEHKTAELTLRALNQALKGRTPRAGMIFHSDRGSEYGAHLLQRALQRHGIRCSMNRPGQCTDNGHMESFFHSMKAELVHGVHFRSERELRRALAGYINHFYNRNRLHSSLNDRTPVEYERMVA